MYDVNSNFFQLVSPIKCKTFINVLSQQPAENYNLNQSHAQDSITHDEFVVLLEKKDSLVSRVDCVILHSTCRPFYKNTPDENEIDLSENLIEKLYCTLRPGAVAVIKGEISIKFNLRGLVSFAASFQNWLKKPIRLTGFGSYVKILNRHGFRNTRTFNILSSWNAPHTIISTDYTASKFFFSNYIEVRREEYTLFKYLIIKLLISLNLIRYMEKSFLVVTQK